MREVRMTREKPISRGNFGIKAIEERKPNLKISQRSVQKVSLQRLVFYSAGKLTAWWRSRGKNAWVKRKRKRVARKRGTEKFLFYFLVIDTKSKDFLKINGLIFFFFF